MAKAQISNSASLQSTDESVDILDSLLESFYDSNPAWAFYAPDYDLLGYAVTDTPRFSPEIIAERISNINSPIAYTYNKQVQTFIDLYTLKRRKQMSNMLALSQVYFPLFEAELDRRGMPMELKYLPVIESALNTHAVSKAGATGLWQFMLGTGKLKGLRIDSYVDERRDPRLATIAGCAYLQDLYKIYGDWLLAIAAYNCGPGNVNKALRKVGGDGKDFWDIEKYLPKETKAYVPIFIAATYAFEYHKEHNIRPAVFGYDLNMTDTLMITRKMTLQELSPFIGISTEEIALHNPALKTKTIPGAPIPYPLILPQKAVAAFYANKDTLYAALDAKTQITKQQLAVNVAEVNAAKAPVTKTVVSSESTTTASNSTPINTLAPDTSLADPDAPVNITYYVKKGDNLGYISDWFDCSVAELKKWNKLSTTQIHPGQKLTVTVPAKYASQYAQIDDMSLSQKQKLTDITLISAAPKDKTVVADPQVIYYTVKPGDTLWSICQQYPENSVEKIRELNGMSQNETLKSGVQIKLVK